MWAARDIDGDLIKFFVAKPQEYQGRFYPWQSYTRWLLPVKFLSHCTVIGPGQCVEIEDIKLVRKAKPKRKAKHGSR